MTSPADILGAAVGSALVSMFILVDLWPWMRDRWRAGATAAGIFAGVVAWNVLVNLVRPNGFEAGIAAGQIVSLVIQVIGSAAFAFVPTALVLFGLVGRKVPPGRIVLAGAIVGGVTVLAVLFT